MNSDLKRKLLHFLYPTRCPVCGEFIDASERFCQDCYNKLNRYNGSFTVRGTSGFTSVFVYDENISPAVMLLKNGVCGNADYALGGELADKLKKDGIAQKTDLIIPVPMHKKAKRSRTFNQAELIAKVIGESLGIPVCTNAVTKNKSTAAQKNLNRLWRQFNLKGAFEVTQKSLIENKRILLLDDICTTGSTFAEIAEVLLTNGAAEVMCASCCKTPPPKRKADEQKKD